MNGLSSTSRVEVAGRMQAELRNLTERMSMLAELAQVLKNRLDPVLTPPAPTSRDMAKAMPSSPQGSEVFAILYSLGCSVNGIIENLTETMDRLEV